MSGFIGIHEDKDDPDYREDIARREPQLAALDELRARNVELEAMVQAARADVERAAAFLDQIADHMETAGGPGPAECRAEARKLRGEQPTRNPYGDGDPAEIDGT